MSSGQRRPLFDAPFTQTSSTPILHPRRSISENDSFIDIPFEPYRRRKPNNDQWIVRTAMKAVLLSPVIVLVVWSIAAVAFTHKQMSSSSSSHAAPARSAVQKPPKRGQHWWSRNNNAQHQQQRMMFPAQGSAGFIVQPQFLPAQLLPGQYYAQQDQRMMLPQQQQQQQQQQQLVPLGAAQPNFPLPQMQQQQQFPAQGAQQYYTFPGTEGQVQQQQQPAQGAQQYHTLPEQGQAQQQPAMGAQQYYTFPEQGQEQPLPAQGAAQQYYTFPEEGQEQPQMAELEPPVLQQAQPVLQRAEPRHSNPRRDEKVQYFYYDPRTTVQDDKGNVLYLPQTVYDAYGRPVPLQSLSNAAKEIQIEPPSTMIHQNISANATILNITYSHPNTVNTPVKGNRRGISLPSGLDVSSAWGESTAGDSSIIVATVGVMALLVGALSARRMRARSILAACIENEALLEDEAAYDTAYTVNASNHHYNTFQQGWKGDLEKFDV